jgi:hypothetical protein
MVFDGKADGGHPLGGPRIHKNIIIVNLKETDGHDMERMQLHQNHVQ